MNKLAIVYLIIKLLKTNYAFGKKLFVDTHTHTIVINS